MGIVTAQFVVVFGAEDRLPVEHIPTANSYLSVDASNPFVPMGTKVVMMVSNIL